MKRLIALSAVLLAAASITVRSAEISPEIKAIYKKECSRCHGDDGKGDTRMGKKMGAKDYTKAEHQAALKDEKKMSKAIREGLKEDGKTKMKPNKELKDEEIKGLILYMRTFAKP